MNPLASQQEEHVLSQLAMMSLARLARLGQEEQLEASKSSQVVCLRKAAEDCAGKAPLVLIHPIGGSILPYRDLTKGLRAGCAVYAIQSQADEAHNSLRHETMETLASNYLDQLSAIGVKDGFVLSGYSLGGALAFEMACQQVERRGRVPLLLIIDTPARIRPSSDVSDQPVTSSQLLMFGQFLAGRSAGGLGLTAEDLEQLPTAARIQRVLGRLREIRVIPRQAGDEAYHAIYEMARHNEFLQRQYEPKRYRGALAVIRTQVEAPELRIEAAASYDEPAFGWQQHCEELVRVSRVPGSHFQLLYPPFITALSAAVQSALDRI